MIATTTVSVWRGDGPADAFGDVPPAPMVVGTEHLKKIPASIIETDRSVWDEALQQRRTVRVFAGRVRSHHDVAKGDRLLDNKTGATYVVEGRTAPRGLAGINEVRLALRSTTTP